MLAKNRLINLKSIRNTKGIETIEFIAVFPFLLLFMLVGFELFRMLLSYNTVVQAAEEAARVQAVTTPYSATNARAKACNILLLANIACVPANLDFQCSGGACTFGTDDGSQVCATAHNLTFNTIFPDFIPGISSIPFPSYTSCVRYET
jgi:Flp pilus assembly protein TadG